MLNVDVVFFNTCYVKWRQYQYHLVSAFLYLMNIHLINIQYKTGLENKCTTLL
jgi:hypothetical protein